MVWIVDMPYLKLGEDAVPKYETAISGLMPRLQGDLAWNYLLTNHELRVKDFNGDLKDTLVKLKEAKRNAKQVILVLQSRVQRENAKLRSSYETAKKSDLLASNLKKLKRNEEQFPVEKAEIYASMCEIIPELEVGMVIFRFVFILEAIMDWNEGRLQLKADSEDVEDGILDNMPYETVYYHYPEYLASIGGNQAGLVASELIESTENAIIEGKIGVLAKILRYGTPMSRLAKQKLSDVGKKGKSKEIEKEVEVIIGQKRSRDGEGDDDEVPLPKKTAGAQDKASQEREDGIRGSLSRSFSVATVESKSKSALEMLNDLDPTSRKLIPIGRQLGIKREAERKAEIERRKAIIEGKEKVYTLELRAAKGKLKQC